MGCDIHLYTEFKKDGAWKTGDVWVPSKYADEGETESKEIPRRFRCYDDRNYTFFAWLAGVRNATWGDQLAPIFEPRGTPEDSCAEIMAMVNQWDSDGHSHSYLTLAEIEAAYTAAKDTKITFDAAVDDDLPAIIKWLKLPEETRGAPASYAAGMYRPGRPEVRAKWSQPLTELIERGYGKIRSFLWDLHWDESVKPEDVRIVFFFDN